MNSKVTAWAEEVILPTYKIGVAEKNPIFLEKRVYQGSSGAVYPHAVVETISDEKTDEKYQAVFIENEYLKIMILPALGGRVHRAWDKIRQRDFVYYNQVVKPALVGLTGPWISGGIEFNWPQHHRPSTYQPTDFTIEENTDGSKTIWVNEVERMFRTKGMAGFTLYPGKAYLEIKGKLYNRTTLPQTFLWWANPAVKVNDHYQSVFPPDVYAVFDHGKRDVSDFPIATGTYYKVDYSPGTDISRYKNIPVPTSYMAIRSDYNFMGGYEHDTKAGMLHVANHHISPGKKQWTWGNGAFGQAWDRNLTDEDGPYIELMCGVFTDNQPDFAWIQPNEVKNFEQYFMPYAEVGMVKNATKEAAIGIEKNDAGVEVKLYTTAEQASVEIKLLHNDDVLAQWTSSVNPASPFVAQHAIADAETKLFTVVAINEQGKELVAYEEKEPELNELPPAATAAPLPADAQSVEQLFLHGHHIEQYRHATYAADDYYKEALRREPGDIRCNNAMGLFMLRRGQFAKAEPFFRTAIHTATSRNPNPYDGEPYYNLGLCLMLQAKYKDAYSALYKATWNDAWQHAAFLQIARIDARRGDYATALQHVEQSLVKNSLSHTARHLKTTLLRKLGRVEDALAFAAESIKLDPFNYGCHFEATLIEQTNGDTLYTLMRGDWNNFIEYALDYAQAGFYKEAILLLAVLLQRDAEPHAMVLYYMAWCHRQSGKEKESIEFYQRAANASSLYVFPNKLEDIIVLQAAIQQQPNDSKAHYYLGNIWYAFRQYDEAINAWQTSAALHAEFPTVHRNLALALYNVLEDAERALASMEKAFLLDTSDARVLMELDQLKKTMNHPVNDRFAVLEMYFDVVQKRDDLYLEYITMLNNQRRYEEALALLEARQFHPWEGGEGKTVGQFLVCITELAKQAIQRGDYQQALTLLHRTEAYPENLGEGKLYGTQENDIRYLEGCAYEGLGLAEKAKKCFELATKGISEPVQAMFYNDPQPDKIVYQSLAWRKLGAAQKSVAIAERLVQFGKQHYDDDMRVDYFAVSLPDLLVFNQDLNLRNKIHCLYLQALGAFALGNYEQARGLFEEVLRLNVNHAGAMVHLDMVEAATKSLMAMGAAR